MAKRKSCGHGTASRVTSEVTATGFILNLPPVGISHAGHGSFWVGLCFCGGVAIIATCFLVFPHLGGTHKGVYVPPTHEPMPWQAWAIIVFFGVISLAITFMGLRWGRRASVIEVAGDTLRIEERDPISRRRFEWDRSELKAIQTGPSGFASGSTTKPGRACRSGKSIQQLHVYLKGGERVRFLTGRDAGEIDEVAAQLRNALHLDTAAYDGG